jgi:hypothetical protein
MSTGPVLTWRDHTDFFLKPEILAIDRFRTGFLKKIPFIALPPPGKATTDRITTPLKILMALKSSDG